MGNKKQENVELVEVQEDLQEEVVVELESEDQLQPKEEESKKKKKKNKEDKKADVTVRFKTDVMFGTRHIAKVDYIFSDEEFKKLQKTSFDYMVI